MLRSSLLQQASDHVVREDGPTACPSRCLARKTFIDLSGEILIVMLSKADCSPGAEEMALAQSNDRDVNCRNLDENLEHPVEEFPNMRRIYDRQREANRAPAPRDADAVPRRGPAGARVAPLGVREPGPLRRASLPPWGRASRRLNWRRRSAPLSAPQPSAPRASAFENLVGCARTASSSSYR